MWENGFSEVAYHSPRLDRKNKSRSEPKASTKTQLPFGLSGRLACWASPGPGLEAMAITETYLTYLTLLTYLANLTYLTYLTSPTGSRTTACDMPVYSPGHAQLPSS